MATCTPAANVCAVHINLVLHPTEEGESRFTIFAIIGTSASFTFGASVLGPLSAGVDAAVISKVL